MKRPIKSEYLTCNQIEYSSQLQKYYDDLELYVTHLESQLKTKITKGIIPMIMEDGEYKKTDVPFKYNEMVDDLSLITFEGRMLINKDGYFKFVKGQWVECDENWMPINKVTR